MKIVTVNVPESYIEAINKLIGEDGLFPSRSELIRVAVREFLLKELRMAKNMAKYNEPEFEEVFDDKNFVRVPIEKREIMHEYKCPICFSISLVKERQPHTCQKCFERNGSKYLMKYSKETKVASAEPVREYKTFKIIQRLD